MYIIYEQTNRLLKKLNRRLDIMMLVLTLWGSYIYEQNKRLLKRWWSWHYDHDVRLDIKKACTADLLPAETNHVRTHTDVDNKNRRNYDARCAARDSCEQRGAWNSRWTVFSWRTAITTGSQTRTANVLDSSHVRLRKINFLFTTSGKWGIIDALTLACWMTVPRRVSLPIIRRYPMLGNNGCTSLTTPSKSLWEMVEYGNRFTKPYSRILEPQYLAKRVTCLLPLFLKIVLRENILVVLYWSGKKVFHGHQNLVKLLCNPFPHFPLVVNKKLIFRRRTINMMRFRKTRI